MVTEPIEDYLTEVFIEQVNSALGMNGFVSDEHDFAPYRETVARHYKIIERALGEAGFKYTLNSGFVSGHPKAGYAYFIYDMDRFASTFEADAAVVAWLDTKYEARSE
ncbi:hypothetical protein [Hwanghaeella sp. LZ110]|uniref:hypothetical protein n=1 Tax=Hwanghaeella sp. LZ110 TaxID=3402810 RepID=UPI003B6747EF